MKTRKTVTLEIPSDTGETLTETGENPAEIDKPRQK
jgi:hypothetical protein